MTEMATKVAAVGTADRRGSNMNYSQTTGRIAVVCWLGIVVTDHSGGCPDCRKLHRTGDTRRSFIQQHLRVVPW